MIHVFAPTLTPRQFHRLKRTTASGGGHIHVGIVGLVCADTMPARIAETATIAERIVYYVSLL